MSKQKMFKVTMVIGGNETDFVAAENVSLAKRSFLQKRNLSTAAVRTIVAKEVKEPRRPTSRDAAIGTLVEWFLWVHPEFRGKTVSAGRGDRPVFVECDDQFFGIIDTIDGVEFVALSQDEVKK